MLELSWKSIGPARPQGAEVPPVSMQLNGYVLTFDAALGRTVYVCGPAYDGFGLAWSYDGNRWVVYGDNKIMISGEGHHMGGYDASRKGIVLWRIGDGDDGPTMLGALLTATGLSELEGLTGSIDFGEVESWDQGALLAHDPARAVWVCLTRVGLWELGADGVWTRRLDAPGVPAEWKDEGWGGGYDPSRKATVFWLFDSSDDVYRFYSWDGTSLVQLSNQGLDPEELGSEAHALIAVHPTRGLTLSMHDKGTFVLGAGGWQRDASAPVGPPLMAKGHMVWDPVLNVFMAGPGEHDGKSGAQRLFYKIDAQTCHELGVKAEPSPIKEGAYGQTRHVMWRGRWYAVSKSCLEMWRWDDSAGWEHVVDEETGRAEWGWGDVTVVATESALLAVTKRGAVFSYDGAAWTGLVLTHPEGWGERDDFELVALPDGKVIAWGGAHDGRHYNDSFVLEGKQWRHVTAPSRLPRDFKNIKDQNFVDFASVWDPKIGAPVRFGLAEVAIWMSERWQLHVVPRYDELLGGRRWQHFPAVDAATGEILLVNMGDNRVVRFDVAGCTEVATFAETPILQNEPEKRHAAAKLRETIVFDAGQRRFLAQDSDDRWGSFALDLTPAFAAAAALGERTIPASVPPPPPGATLYRAVPGKGVEVWSYRVLGAALEVSTGPLGAERTETTTLASPEAALAEATRLEAARKADGFKGALELEPAEVRAIACVTSEKLVLLAAEGKKRARDEDEGEDEDEDEDEGEDEDEDKDEDEDEDEDDEEESEDDDERPRSKAKSKAAPRPIVGRLGGQPNGLSADRWPRSGSKPMGFLIQLELGDRVPGYAGVAVFCVTDGTATEDEEGEDGLNVAILLTAEELAGPETPTPKGVRAMPPRPIEVHPPRGEIHERRMEPLIERDMLLGQAIDALLASGDGLQKGNLTDKRGGLPAWVQHEARDEAGFLFMLDFDRIRLDEAWEEAGLAGCLFVFADPDGKATAFWQYT